MRKPNVITISGAGSSRTPALIGTLVEMKERFPLEKIIFFDPNIERFQKIEDYCRLVLETHSPETEIIVTNDMDEAYSNTEYVFCCMRVGGTEMRSLDEKIPLKHGVVGQETCGPGGFAYGLRSIGDMVEMVNKVREYSDETWILNYTNPAAIVAVAMDKYFPNDNRILNICDQPYSMMVSFAKIFEIDVKDLRARYFGLNHFGWFTELYDTEGNDYFEELKTYFKEHGFKPYNAEQRDQSWLDTYLRVNEMLKHFPDYIPNTYLQYYFYKDDIVAEMDPKYTRADEAVHGREAEVWKTTGQAVGVDNMDGIELLTSPVFGSMMVEVAESIAYDLDNEFILIVKNDDVIPNFREDAFVEVACELGKDGPKPFKYGKIETFYKGLMENQYAYELLTVEAYMEKSYEKALMALTLNRTINGIDQAKAVLDDLNEANKEYWYFEEGS